MGHLNKDHLSTRTIALLRESRPIHMIHKYAWILSMVDGYGSEPNPLWINPTQIQTLFGQLLANRILSAVNLSTGLVPTDSRAKN